MGKLDKYKGHCFVSSETGSGKTILASEVLNYNLGKPALLPGKGVGIVIPDLRKCTDSIFFIDLFANKN